MFVRIRKGIVVFNIFPIISKPFARSSFNFHHNLQCNLLIKKIRNFTTNSNTSTSANINSNITNNANNNNSNNNNNNNNNNSTPSERYGRKYFSSHLLVGLTAVVSGGTSGIGLAIATQLAQHGASVVVLSRHRVRATEASDWIRAQVTNHSCKSLPNLDQEVKQHLLDSPKPIPVAFMPFMPIRMSQPAPKPNRNESINDTNNSNINPHNHYVFGVECDVTNSLAVNTAISFIESKLGRIDILVNAAGISKDNLIVRVSDTELQATINTNLYGTYYLCRAVSKLMLSKPLNSTNHSEAHQHSYSIINIGSIVGTAGNSGQTVYSSSKSAIIGLTKSLSKELANRNIRVNCISPGFIATPMTETMNEAQKQAILAKIPLNRMGEPEEIAQLCLFLVSPAANYITGQNIAIDGGIQL